RCTSGLSRSGAAEAPRSISLAGAADAAQGGAFARAGAPNRRRRTQPATPLPTGYAVGGVSSRRRAPVALATTDGPDRSTRRVTDAVVVWPWSQIGGASRSSSQWYASKPT